MIASLRLWRDSNSLNCSKAGSGQRSAVSMTTFSSYPISLATTAAVWVARRKRAGDDDVHRGIQGRQRTSYIVGLLDSQLIQRAFGVL